MFRCATPGGTKLRRTARRDARHHRAMPRRTARGEAMQRNDLMQKWAESTRRHDWNLADRLWKQLMKQWLTQPVVDQQYWNRLLTRKMNALERKDRRSAFSDNEFDNTYGDKNQ